MNVKGEGIELKILFFLERKWKIMERNSKRINLNKKYYFLQLNENEGYSYSSLYTSYINSFNFGV